MFSGSGWRSGDAPQADQLESVKPELVDSGVGTVSSDWKVPMCCSSRFQKNRIWDFRGSEI